MLKIFISFMLGPFGMMLQKFYIENSLIINSIVVIYGLFLVVSNLNYKKILESAYMQIEDKTKTNNKTTNKKQKISWTKAIEEGSFFPFIAGALSFIPYRVSVSKIEKISIKDKRWQKILNKKKSGKKIA